MRFYILLFAIFINSQLPAQQSQNSFELIVIGHGISKNDAHLEAFHSAVAQGVNIYMENPKGINLKSIKYTLEFGVATVGQGERGGERILSLYDVIFSPTELDFASFPQYKIRTINALLQIDAQIRQQILAKTKPQSFLEKANDFNKNTGWWNTLKDSFKGIQESLITRN